MRGSDEVETVVQRGHPRQVDLPTHEGRLGEMEMRIGQPGDRDLIGRELDPLRERVGPGLQPHLGPGERDPSIADPHRLHPAEAGLARQGGDPACHEHVERQRSGLRVRQQRGQPGPIQPGAHAQRERDPRLGPAQVPGRDGPGPDPGRSPPSKAYTGLTAPDGQREARTTGIPACIARTAAASTGAALLPEPSRR